jgi:hypothetical protein
VQNIIAKDCCRTAIITEDVDLRAHWLEAAARWISLARQQNALPPPWQTSQDAENSPA